MSCRCYCHCPSVVTGKMTPEEFKQQFKVGDTIRAWSTRKEMTITAIGKERFLYTDFRNHGEWVCAMDAAGRFELVVEPRETERGKG